MGADISVLLELQSIYTIPNRPSRNAEGKGRVRERTWGGGKGGCAGENVETNGGLVFWLAHQMKAKKGQDSMLEEGGGKRWTQIYNLSDISRNDELEKDREKKGWGTEH